MSIKILSFQNKGKAADEFIELEVIQDCNLMNYAVADTTYNEEGKVENVWRHFHRFLPASAKKGDRVLLYTRKGTNDVRVWEKSPGVKVKVYDRYWGFSNPILNDGGDCVALYNISFLEGKKK